MPSNKPHVYKMRLSEFTKLSQERLLKKQPFEIEHLDIIVWDTEYKSDVPGLRLAGCNGLENLASLDISRLGLENDDIRLLFSSPFIQKLRWLNLAGNTAVGVDAIRWICWNIREGTKHKYPSFHQLQWIDLRGTACDATPYMDPEFSDKAYWRMPRITYELAEEFGFQKWMTMGFNPEEANEKHIDAADYPPDRFHILKS